MKAAAGLLASKFALGPVLLPQSRWLKRNALRLPEAAGPREGRIGRGEPVLWGELRQRTGASWGVVCGLPPMQSLTAVPHPLRWYLGRYAAWLDASLRRWAGQQDLGYCSLQFAAHPGALALDGFHPGPSLYPRWAQALAQIIAEGRGRWARQP